MDAFGSPSGVFVGGPPDVGRDGRGAVDGVVAGTIGAFDQPTGGQLTLAYASENFGEDFDGEPAGEVTADGGGEFGGQRVELRCLRSELRIEHTYDYTCKRPARTPYSQAGVIHNGTRAASDFVGRMCCPAS